jgi:ActR/RegA family two-component response regulator
MTDSRPITHPVLLVDDDTTIQTVLGRLLARRGYDVQVASSVANAIELAQRTDMVAAILDLHLANGGSGLDVLTWLRSKHRYAAMPVMILTGHVVLSEDQEEQIRRLNAYVFYKPVATQALIDYIGRFTQPPS